MVDGLRTVCSVVSTALDLSVKRDTAHPSSIPLNSPVCVMPRCYPGNSLIALSFTQKRTTRHVFLTTYLVCFNVVFYRQKCRKTGFGSAKPRFELVYTHIFTRTSRDFNDEFYVTSSVPTQLYSARSSSAL